MAEQDFRNELLASAREYFPGRIHCVNIPDDIFQDRTLKGGGIQRPFDMGIQCRGHGFAACELKQIHGASLAWSRVEQVQEYNLLGMAATGAPFSGIVVQFRARVTPTLRRRFAKAGVEIQEGPLVQVYAIPINVWTSLRSRSLEAGLSLEACATEAGILEIPSIPGIEYPNRWDLEALFGTKTRVRKNNPAKGSVEEVSGVVRARPRVPRPDPGVLSPGDSRDGLHGARVSPPGSRPTRPRARRSRTG